MRKTKKSVEQVAHDLDRLRADLEHLSEAFKDGVAQKTKQAIADVTEQAKEQAWAAEQAMEGVVKDRPLTSVLVAAGIGLAVGTLFWR